MSGDVFEEIADILTQTFPGTYGPAGWRLVLGDVEPRAVKAAFATWLASDTSGRAPAPGQIRALLAEEMRAAPIDAALAEFNRKRTGGDPTTPPEWSIPEIAAAVDAVGGWAAVLSWLIKDRATNLAQFREAFRAAWERGQDARRHETVRSILGGSAPALGRGGSLAALGGGE